MESSANKALTIGVAVFITIMITSAILFILGRMQDVYSKVYETDISIQNQFDEFDSFDNTTKTGIETLNAIKEYINNPYVTIKFKTNIVLEKGKLIGTYQNDGSIERGIKSIVFNNPSSTKNIGEGLAKANIEKNDDFVIIIFSENH